MNWNCIESKLVEEVIGYSIYREVDRQRDYCGEYHGSRRVFYAVCDEYGDMLESFKTLRDAKKYATA